MADEFCSMTKLLLQQESKKIKDFNFNLYIKVRYVDLNLIHRSPIKLFY